MTFHKARILEAIEDSPGIHTAKLCRHLNQVNEYVGTHGFCGVCIDFANPRKRATKEIHKACPTIRLKLLQYHLKTLIVAGRIHKKREVKPDGQEHRGWDIFSCYYCNREL